MCYGSTPGWPFASYSWKRQIFLDVLVRGHALRPHLARYRLALRSTAQLLLKLLPRKLQLASMVLPNNAPRLLDRLDDSSSLVTLLVCLLRSPPLLA